MKNSKIFLWGMTAAVLTTGLMLAGCDSIMDNLNSGATVTSVTVNPSNGSVAKGGNQTFSATVNGTNNPAQTVRWSIDETNKDSGTTINGNGILTVAASESLGSLTIRAISVVDTSKSGTANVTITGGGNGNGNDNNGDGDDNNGDGDDNNGDGGMTSKPNTPTGVTATAQSSTSIRITWNAVSGATSYKIYSPDDPGSSSNFIYLDTTTTTSYTDTYPEPGETWYYKVSAINSAGESALSSSVSATTQANYRIDQALFTTNSKSGNNLIFNWKLTTTGNTLTGFTYTSPSSIVVSIRYDDDYFDLETLAGSARTYTLQNFATWAQDDRVIIRLKCISAYNETISYVVYRPSVNTFTPSY